MSTPFLDHEDPLRGAMSEIISAQSALNMEPCPVNPPPVKPEGQAHEPFLSESDEWAKHAMEHLHAAFQLLQRADTERAKLRDTRGVAATITALTEAMTAASTAHKAEVEGLRNLLSQAQRNETKLQRERADLLVALVLVSPFFFPPGALPGDTDTDVRGAANPDWVKAARGVLDLDCFADIFKNILRQILNGVA